MKFEPAAEIGQKGAFCKYLNVALVIRKLEAKKQTAQQKQAYHAVSLYYELSGATSFERIESFENKDEKFTREKNGIKLMNADWVPVYDG